MPIEKEKLEETLVRWAKDRKISKDIKVVDEKDGIHLNLDH